MSVIALIPARSGSTGIPGKNFRRLGDTPINITAIAVGCAIAAKCDIVAVSSDAEPIAPKWLPMPPSRLWIRRPAELATDSASMLAVVQHALAQIPGEPDDLIVLLQPTQPFRTPVHIQQAMTLLRETQADSVVSVVRLPATHHPDWVLVEQGGQLWQWCEDGSVRGVGDPMTATRPRATRRQDLEPAYKRDGTVYAFWRKTVEQHGTIYGDDVRPLLIDPADSCELDTEADWAAVEARWKAQHEG